MSETELWPALIVLITAMVMDGMGLGDGQSGLSMVFYRSLARGQKRGLLMECIGLLGGGIEVFSDRPVTCGRGSALKGPLRAVRYVRFLFDSFLPTKIYVVYSRYACVGPLANWMLKFC